MKTTPLLQLAPLLCLSAIIIQAATPVIVDDFTGPAPDSRWKTSAGCITTNGTLVMQNAATETSKDRTQGLVYTDNLQRLNFLKTPVTIEIGTLDIQGTASPQNSVFMLYLADNKNVSAANYALQLRIDGGGTAVLWLYAKSVDRPAQKRTQLAFLPCILPLEKITLTFNSGSSVITLKDASGEQGKAFELTPLIDPVRWEQPEYHLLIQGVTKNDSGTTLISLGKISVISGEN